MRRLILLAITLTALMAATTTTAHAQDVLAIDSATQDTCDDAYGELVIDGNDVSGGCLVEDFTGTYQLAAPEIGVFTSCNTSFDLRIGLYGNYAIYDQSTSYSSCGGSPRQVCHDGTTPYSEGEPLVWTGQLALDGGQIVAEGEICTQNPNNPGYYVWMDVTFEVGLAETGSLPSIESLTSDGEDPICQGCGWLESAEFDTSNDDSVDLIF
jgi:hypothetical protein